MRLQCCHFLDELFRHKVEIVLVGLKPARSHCEQRRDAVGDGVSVRERQSPLQQIVAPLQALLTEKSSRVQMDARKCPRIWKPVLHHGLTDSTVLCPLMHEHKRLSTKHLEKPWKSSTKVNATSLAIKSTNAQPRFTPFRAAGTPSRKGTPFWTLTCCPRSVAACPNSPRPRATPTAYELVTTWFGVY